MGGRAGVVGAGGCGGVPPVVMGRVLGQDRPRCRSPKISIRPVTSDRGGAHEPFRITVRPRGTGPGSSRPGYRHRPGSRQTTRELPVPVHGISVPDQELRAVGALAEIHERVPGLPGGPGGGGVGGDGCPSGARTGAPARPCSASAARDTRPWWRRTGKGRLSVTASSQIVAPRPNRPSRRLGQGTRPGNCPARTLPTYTDPARMRP
jgi:hypothetical protein